MLLQNRRHAQKMALKHQLAQDVHILKQRLFLQKDIVIKMVFVKFVVMQKNVITCAIKITLFGR